MTTGMPDDHILCWHQQLMQVIGQFNRTTMLDAHEALSSPPSLPVGRHTDSWSAGAGACWFAQGWREMSPTGVPCSACLANCFAVETLFVANWHKRSDQTLSGCLGPKCTCMTMRAA